MLFTLLLSLNVCVFTFAVVLVGASPMDSNELNEF